MRLWVFSDLHLEFSTLTAAPAIPDADVCVVAGDILDRGIAPSIRWLGENISAQMPVVFVAGNHEYYRSFMDEALAAAEAEALKWPNLYFLENREVTIGGVVFIGATMWTDFGLYGTPAISAQYARSAMSDYRLIKLRKRPYRALQPIDTIRTYQRSYRYITERLEHHRESKTVVVTHHAPSRRSIPPRYEGNDLSPSFTVELDREITNFEPNMWIHGHVHDPCEFSIGATRIVCNPAGYPGERVEKPFDWCFVRRV